MDSSSLRSSEGLTCCLPSRRKRGRRARRVLPVLAPSPTAHVPLFAASLLFIVPPGHMIVLEKKTQKTQTGFEHLVMSYFQLIFSTLLYLNLLGSFRVGDYTGK